ncbi:MAG: nuclear transport factor 2 family protein [Cyclobacteriaceae bacterium]|nr:nuclear transport factor 2 family protein [Cyclobacteriaceae bacterium]
MKSTILLLLLSTSLQAQLTLSDKQQKAIASVINKYTQARETKDTVLLKAILTPDIDQLVSSGEWRTGMSTAVQGMLRSSESNSGKRTITIEKIRLLTKTSAIVDARYEIRTSDGSARNMWSTFIVVQESDTWKIAAIRNMLPQK